MSEGAVDIVVIVSSTKPNCADDALIDGVKRAWRHA